MKKYGIVPHAELESAHYALVRTNPDYRQYLWQTYHEVEHEPSNAALYEKALAFEANQQASTPEKALMSTNKSASIIQIRSLLVDLQNRLNTHIDPKKKQGDII